MQRQRSPTFQFFELIFFTSHTCHLYRQENKRNAQPKINKKKLNGQKINAQKTLQLIRSIVQRSSSNKNRYTQKNMKLSSPPML